MAFTGFVKDDFDVFSLPEFDTRMSVLKERITPKLKALAEELCPHVLGTTGLELFPHVAQHIRRSVHPADETWAALGRNVRAYKPYVHLKIAINGAGIKIACFMEDDASDKLVLAEGLKRNAASLAAYLKEHPRIRSHHGEANYGKLLDGKLLGRTDIEQFAERLVTVKSQHANFSIKFPHHDVTNWQATLIPKAVEALTELAPVYRLGAEPGFIL